MRAMPVPQKEGPRANRDIRGVREVQLIDETGQNRGVVSFFDALHAAEEAGLDLVEIAPNSAPPVCKLLDYGKFRFNEQKKQAEAQGKNKELQGLLERQKTQASVLSDAAASQLAKDIEKAQRDLQYFQNEYQAELETLNNDLMREFQQQVLPLVQAIATA